MHALLWGSTTISFSHSECCMGSGLHFDCWQLHFALFFIQLRGHWVTANTWHGYSLWMNVETLKRALPPILWTSKVFCRCMLFCEVVLQYHSILRDAASSLGELEWDAKQPTCRHMEVTTHTFRRSIQLLQYGYTSAWPKPLKPLASPCCEWAV